jgi:hypothetical protein
MVAAASSAFDNLRGTAIGAAAGSIMLGIFAERPPGPGIRF